MKQYFVYILANKRNTVLYTGCTDDLVKRVYQHKNKVVEGFTKKYNVDKLVYYELTEDAMSMINREKTIKNLLRIKKLMLIKGMNPDFSDLYETLL